MNLNPAIYFKEILDNQAKLALQEEPDKTCQQPIDGTCLEKIKE